MRKTHGWFAGLVLGLGILAGTGQAVGDKDSAWKALVPAKAFKGLVTREATILDENLKGTPDQDQLKRAKLAALMIAGFSLSVKDEPRAAAVQQAAFKLAKLLDAQGKLDDARKLAASLSSLKADSSAKLGPVDAKTNLPDLDDVMNHLRTKKKGGDGIHPSLQTNIRLKGALNGIEEKIRSLAAKKLADAALKKCAEEMVYMGYRTAVFAQLIHDYPPPKKGTGGAKAWRDLSIETRDAAVELAQASEKKDAEAVLKAGNRLNSSCSQCHSAFR